MKQPEIQSSEEGLFPPSAWESENSPQVSNRIYIILLSEAEADPTVEHMEPRCDAVFSNSPSHPRNPFAYRYQRR